jgi:hypothetical protein
MGKLKIETTRCLEFQADLSSGNLDLNIDAKQYLDLIEEHVHMRVQSAMFNHGAYRFERQQNVGLMFHLLTTNKPGASTMFISSCPTLKARVMDLVKMIVAVLRR